MFWLQCYFWPRILIFSLEISHICMYLYLNESIYVQFCLNFNVSKNELDLIFKNSGYASSTARNEANVNIYLHLSDDEDPNYANSKILLFNANCTATIPVLFDNVFSTISAFQRNCQKLSNSLILLGKGSGL